MYISSYLVLQDADFPRMWAERVKIRSIVPLSEQLTTKIQAIHRLNFYRQKILDLTKENSFQQILVLTQEQFNNEIVIHLIKDNTFQQLVKLNYQASHEHLLKSKDIADEQTFQAENQEIKRQIFAQKKIEFILQALIVCHKISGENTKNKFFDKIFASGVMQMAIQYLDRGILRALDFFNSLSQLIPERVMEYLRNQYRQKPYDNLQIKLSRKYCVGSEQMQGTILEIVKHLSVVFKVKENLDFFMGTFFASIFGNCKDDKAILNIISQIQNHLENIDNLFLQIIQKKVFDKLVMFLRSQRQDKFSELKAIKILKRVLLENADSSWSFKKTFLNQINRQMITSGWFDYCMMVLSKHLRFNNIISSSMLENLRIIRQMNHYTCFHKEIQMNYRDVEGISKHIEPILLMKEEKTENVDEFNKQKQKQMEQEKQQAYLMSEMVEEQKQTSRNEDNKEQLEQLNIIRKEIEEERIKEEKQVQKAALPTKKVKKDESIQMQIEFKLQFDQIMENIK